MKKYIYKISIKKNFFNIIILNFIEILLNLTNKKKNKVIFLMEKIYQFNNLNENNSHDQLFDFTKPESTNKKTIPHKTLIEKLINKISPLNESISSIHLNNSISSNKYIKDKNIDFIDNKKKASQLTDSNKQRKSLNSLTKKKRKSSSMNLMDNNPLNFIESLKKIDEKKSNYL